MPKIRPLRIFNQRKNPYIKISNDKVNEDILRILVDNKKDFIKNVKIYDNFKNRNVRVNLKDLSNETTMRLLSQPINIKKKKKAKIQKNELSEVFKNVIRKPPRQGRRYRLPKQMNYLLNKIDENLTIKKLEQKISDLEKQIKSTEDTKQKKELEEIKEVIQKKMNKNIKAIEPDNEKYDLEELDLDGEILIVPKKIARKAEYAQQLIKEKTENVEKLEKDNLILSEKNIANRQKYKDNKNTVRMQVFGNAKNDISSYVNIYNEVFNKKDEIKKKNKIKKKDEIKEFRTKLDIPERGFSKEARKIVKDFILTELEMKKDEKENEESKKNLQKKFNTAVDKEFKINKFAEESREEDEEEIKSEEKIEGSGSDKEGLSDEQIDSIMSQFPNYYGCLSNDNIMETLEKIKIEDPHQFYLLYLKKNKGKVGHWIAIFCDFDEMEINYYDSFGETADTYLKNKFKILFTGMKIENLMKWKDNHIVQQGDSDLCGIYCMWFIIQRIFGFSFKQATDWKDIDANEKRFSLAKINFHFI